MQIVIEVSDTLMEYIIQGRDLSEEQNDEMAYAIADGTPLPKHHGRLIDADKLRETMEKDPRKALSFVDLTDFVWLAPTIIEAEGSESE